MLSFVKKKILRKDRTGRKKSKKRNITWNENVADENNEFATKLKPPENELQKVGVSERKMSEHELRVQRSLQKLNVPEWYKNSAAASGGQQQSFLLKRHNDSSSVGGHNKQNAHTPHRWNTTSTTLPSKTTSLSSLGTTLSTPRSPTGGTSAVSPTTYTFSRWSTSRLNSATSSNSTSPSGSARSSFNYRQPYLGWRSQEKLSKPRTPAERLAAGILPHQNQASQHFSPSLTEVRSSIKEVTSAIVHYVSGAQHHHDASSSDRLTPSPRYLTDSSSRSTSPRGSTGKLCWVESSFVGSRPLDIVETPSPSNIDDVKTLNGGKSKNNNLFLNLDPNNAKCNDKSSTINNQINENGKYNTFGQNWATNVQDEESNNKNRRVSFEEATANTFEKSNEQIPPRPPLIQCQYPKCAKVSDFAKAKRTYKVCHNCDFMYCSRECRRSHWDKHRKACLHSRVGELCRNVLTMIKQNDQLLYNASLIARKGFLTQGRGCVKYFFSNPQTANHFTMGKFNYAEPVFVKYTDISQNETGSVLYSELQRVCKSYNPETKMVLYVAIYVVSEIPTNGPVEWERQIVARCAKTKLSSKIAIRNRTNNHNVDNNPETLILTSVPGTHDSQKTRQINFSNIQRHLRQRGVNLQKQFPDVYKRLSLYAERSSETFTPITIYPTDYSTGKTFMCVIMPDSEPEQVDLIPKYSNYRTIDISKNNEVDSENNV